MNGRMITGISILFLKAYIADHDGDDDDAHDVMLMIIMIKLVTISQEDEGAPIYWSRRPIYWSP